MLGKNSRAVPRHPLSRPAVRHPRHPRRHLPRVLVSRYPVSPLHLLNHHSGKFHCEIPGCQCEEGLSSTPIERQPVLRSPVTQCHLIDVMTGKFRCEIPGCPCIEASKYYADALHDSIYKMVFFFIGQFCSRSSPEVQKDLSQQCLVRIMKNLGRFDPSIAKFSTWAGTVTINVLRHEYKKELRYNNVFDLMAVAREGISASEEPSLRSDIVSAISTIRDLNPKWHKVLDAMFGKPGYPLARNFSVTEVARVTGLRYNEVHVFLTKTVRPFFKNWFQYGGAK